MFYNSYFLKPRRCQIKKLRTNLAVVVSTARYLSILAELHDSEIEVGRYSSFKICSSHEKIVKSGPSTVPVP